MAELVLSAETHDAMYVCGVCFWPIYIQPQSDYFMTDLVGLNTNVRSSRVKRWLAISRSELLKLKLSNQFKSISTCQISKRFIPAKILVSDMSVTFYSLQSH